jgi:hypothetical protein
MVIYKRINSAYAYKINFAKKMSLLSGTFIHHGLEAEIENRSLILLNRMLPWLSPLKSGEP